MARKKSRHASIYMVGPLLWISFLLCSLGATASPWEVRKLKVKIAASAEFKLSGMWKVEMHKMVRDISRSFKSRFGIAFDVEDWDFWQPDPGFRTLPDCLGNLVMKVPRGDCDMVIGMIPSSISQGPPFGAADYLHAYVLIKDHPSKSGLACVLEHELCHIFGAIDLDEHGSIMSVDGRGGRYDAFTTRIMILNRNRSFGAGEFPLPLDGREEVIAFYKERLDQDKERVGSGKVEDLELRIVLSHLLRNKSRSAEVFSQSRH